MVLNLCVCVICSDSGMEKEVSELVHCISKDVRITCTCLLTKPPLHSRFVLPVALSLLPLAGVYITLLISHIQICISMYAMKCSDCASAQFDLPFCQVTERTAQNVHSQPEEVL